MVDSDELRETLIGTLQRVERALGSRGRGRNPRPAGRSAPHAVWSRNWCGPCRATATAARRSGTEPSAKLVERIRRRSVPVPTRAEAVPAETRDPQARQPGAAEVASPVRADRAGPGLRPDRRRGAAEPRLCLRHAHARLAEAGLRRPLFAHPIEVAGILTDYRLDTATIVTALLHDVSRTPTSPARRSPSCSARRSPSWSRASPSSPSWSSRRAPAQAENLRKFILAISKDVRVLLVKLADRLHNMRTLHFIPRPPPSASGSPARRSTSTRRSPARSAATASARSWRSWPSRTSDPAARNAIIRRLEACAPAGRGGRRGLRRDRRPAGGGGRHRGRVYGREKQPVLDLAEAAAQDRSASPSCPTSTPSG